MTIDHLKSFNKNNFFTYIQYFQKKIGLFQHNFVPFQQNVVPIQKKFVPFQKKFELIKKKLWTNHQYFFSFKIRCKYKLNETKNKI